VRGRGSIRDCSGNYILQVCPIHERERQAEPKVKMNYPRLRIEVSSTTAVYHTGYVEVVLKKGLGQYRQHTHGRERNLTRVFLKPSPILDGLTEDMVCFSARRLQRDTPPCSFCLLTPQLNYRCPHLSTHIESLCNLNKVVGTGEPSYQESVWSQSYCLDCKPTRDRP
jgi:hypothetical protein